MDILDLYKNVDSPFISWDKQELDTEMLNFHHKMEVNMWHTLTKISKLPANGSKFKDKQILNTTSAEVEDPDYAYNY